MDVPLLLLLIGVAVGVFYLGNRLAGFVSKKIHTLLGVLTLIGWGLGTFWFGEKAYFYLYPEQQTLSADVLKAMKGLYGACLLLWGISLAQRYQENLRFPLSRYGLAFGGYFIIGMGFLSFGFFCQFLILQTGISPYLSNVFQLAGVDFIIIGSILLFLLGVLLFSLWCMKGIIGLKLMGNTRLIALLAAVFSTLLLAFFLNPPIGLLPLVVSLFIFLVLMDLFAELNAASVVWFGFWVTLLAGLATGYLYKFSLDKSGEQRQLFAQQLSHPEDALAAQQLKALAQSLMDQQNSEEIHWQDSLALIKVKQALDQFPYLQKAYSFDYHLEQSKQISISTAALSRPEVATLLEKWGKKDAEQASLFHFSANPYYYYLGILLPLADSSQMLIALRPSAESSRRAFLSLFPETPFQSFREFAVFYEDQLLIRKGYQKPTWLSASNWDQANPWHAVIKSTRADTYYFREGNYRVAVGEDLGGYFQVISLFSYLFLLLLFLLITVIAINQRLRWFPATLKPFFLGRPSLTHRIQLAVIGLFLAGFLCIGFLTAHAYKNQYAQQQESETLFTLQSVIKSLKASTPSFESCILSNEVLKAQADIHQTDFFLYHKNGLLCASSLPALFEQHFLPTSLETSLTQAFSQNKQAYFLKRDALEGRVFKTLFLPLPTATDPSSSILGVAFPKDDFNASDDLSHFMSQLISVYVFLLLFAGAIAFWITNSITAPLVELGEKLRSFKLGNNEPLEWKSEDEIGELVSEYNQMIVKLEENTEKLKQSERESAWREMAKQVAHEIKNPLTPMKLSIQYLQHAFRSNPGNIGAMLDRISATLTEQIDGLANIATAFSNFAKMPKAENTVFDLRETIHSVYHLFLEQQEQQNGWALDVPQNPVMVFADQKQMLRVFNNLVKNALQAIPEDRMPSIGIQLALDENKALVCITDNGVGIPEDIQAKVFQPNFTTKSSGMGLGLAMCKQIVEEAHGAIYFKTQAALGTQFYVQMPLYI
ncbi:MAG TPA: ATP-binding protein [Saprospiraceae bacterium]|nr:ATP-binding protein [Saprospiraceae bacterium]HMQ83828.1 ATP-binding protein [Saprospiraceae bacterium]